MSSPEELNEELMEHGLSIGLSNDENIGTWEWHERSSGEFRGGFENASLAYENAREYLKTEYGIDVQELSEDGDLVPTSGPTSA